MKVLVLMSAWVQQKILKCLPIQKRLLAAAASSDADIAEVEFFINGASQGKVGPIPDAMARITLKPLLKKLICWDYLQGQHQLSVIARDFLGNEAVPLMVT